MRMETSHFNNFDLFKEIADDATSYLDVDEVINLSMTSTISNFTCLNNLKYKRFIPSENEAKNMNLFDFVAEIEGNTQKNVKEILREIKNLIVIRFTIK